MGKVANHTHINTQSQDFFHITRYVVVGIAHALYSLQNFIQNALTQPMTAYKNYV